MPTFPTYLRDQTPTPPGVPGVDIGAGAVVSGMKQLAAGIGQAGDAMEQYQQRLDKQSMFDDNVKTDRYRVQTENDIKEWQKNIPENATGAAQTFMATRAQKDKDFLATISPQNRSHFEQLLTVDREKVLGATVQTEDAVRNKYEVGILQSGLDKWMTTLRADPSQKDEALKDLGTMIDHTTALSPTQKAEAKKSVEINLLSSKFQAVYANDPAAGMRALGIEMPKAKTSAGGGISIPRTNVSAGQGERESTAMAFFKGRGYSQAQAAGIVGNLIHESGGLQTKIKNPGDGADGSDSIGVAQWNGARARALKDFAAAQGKDWHDYGVQLAFVDHELNTSYSGVKARLMAAQTPDDAAGVIVTGYERPRGSQSGAAASHGWSNRRDQARRLAGGEYTKGVDVDTTGSVEKPMVTGGDPEYAAIPYDMRVKLTDQMQRDYLTMQTQAAADLKLQQSTLQNNLQNLLIDGKAGLPDIEKARQDGWLGDADAVEKMRGIVEKRDKDQADGRMFMQGLGTPGTQFNPFDATQQKGADEAFKAMGGSLEALDTIYGTSGIVPKAAATMMKSGIFGADQAAGSQTLQVASNILAKNPNAFRAVDGGTDIANAAVKFQHFLSQGQTVAAATAKVLEQNDPAYKPKNVVRDEDLKAFTDGITAASVGKLFDQSVLPFNDPRVGANPEQMTSIIADFREVATDFYKQSGDQKLALAQTKAQMEKVYGVTKVLGQDTLTKYPPEKAYPPVGGSYDYITRQAEQEVAKAIGRHILPEDVGLFQAPQTERDFLAGKPVPYQVVYYDTKNGQRTMEILPGGLFTADPGAAQKESRAIIEPKLKAAQSAVMQTEDNFTKAQQDADQRARMGNAPTPEAAAAIAKRPVKPPPPTEVSPAQTLQKQMQDVRGAGIKDMPTLGFGAGENWPDN